MTTMTEDRTRAVDLAIGQIEKQFGRGAIMRMGDQKNLEIEAIPTGSLSLDIALGIGGVPRGRITEIFGPESSGKSTLCQHIIAEAQELGGARRLHRRRARARPRVRRAPAASTSTSCWSRSPTPASRPSRSPRP